MSVFADLSLHNTTASFNGLTPFKTLPETFNAPSKETVSSCCNLSIICFGLANSIPFLLAVIMYLLPPSTPFIVHNPLLSVLYTALSNFISTFSKGTLPRTALTVILNFSFSALNA